MTSLTLPSQPVPPTLPTNPRMPTFPGASPDADARVSGPASRSASEADASGGPTEAERIAAVLQGDLASFEPLIARYSPRVFATARRYARRESEIEDIAQEVWAKAYQKLSSYRGDAPFEHWLMRLTIHTCYDFLRQHQRNREHNFSELSAPEEDWLNRHVADPGSAPEDSAAARELVGRALEMLSPAARLVLTLLEIEDRPVKEIAALTGWSVPLVKVRAFRARAEMKKCLQRIARDKYL